jgi:acetyl-CoA carboxylase carboxyl transferase subunit alpha
MNSTWLEFEKPIVELQRRIDDLENFASEESIEVSQELVRLRKKAAQLKTEVYSNLNRWQRVQLARHPRRPYTLDYVKVLAPDFVELHGDRGFRDDPAIVAGLATLAGRAVVIVGHQKGRDTKENITRNFGMPHPEGYRKALRLMGMAEKFKLPLLSFVDTPGAYPGIGAEERGQAEAIARNLLEMARLPVPFIAVIIGEGGSGGALALAMGDVVLMLENAIYSVITPEGCAAILWKDRAKAPQAAEALKLTARDLQQLRVVDEIIEEPQGGAHWDPGKTAQNVKQAIINHLDSLCSVPAEELVAKRRAKYLAMGVYSE